MLSAVGSPSAYNSCSILIESCTAIVRRADKCKYHVLHLKARRPLVTDQGETIRSRRGRRQRVQTVTGSPKRGIKASVLVLEPCTMRQSTIATWLVSFCERNGFSGKSFRKKRHQQLPRSQHPAGYYDAYKIFTNLFYYFLEPGRKLLSSELAMSTSEPGTSTLGLCQQRWVQLPKGLGEIPLTKRGRKQGNILGATAHTQVLTLLKFMKRNCPVPSIRGFFEPKFTIKQSVSVLQQARAIAFAVCKAIRDPTEETTGDKRTNSSHREPDMSHNLHTQPAAFGTDGSSRQTPGSHDSPDIFGLAVNRSWSTDVSAMYSS
ncbi:hypothetical protein Anapl_17179 [Anas platyrhynchos]|uniref:Uncharacterized protein n=1 Tax=Anas platyrhynchos TaxID=8839 RepID=R0L960_ANAPL|nr:hypothetical protein Anapl_17179 [Anas platyrhynchos]